MAERHWLGTETVVATPTTGQGKDINMAPIGVDSQQQQYPCGWHGFVELIPLSNACL
jgi:hypothetical protein